ncbi:MAG: ParA family protein [Candidatus Hydrogenedentota bacterium]|nr:MAG: ParA family protein [Candidatus Hydrogenedentota bacterium]
MPKSFHGTNVKIISITNQKGGVGKTTTAIHLADGLSRFHDKKVLAVDLDSQKNMSSVFVNTKEEWPKNSFSLFEAEPLTGEGLAQIRENFFLVPASIRLAEVDTMLAGKLDGFFRLREALNRFASEFDYIVLDCPPALSMITINAMVSADYVVIPIQVSKFSIDGIQTILDSISTTQKRYNPYLQLLGAVFCMHDTRTTLSKAMRPEVEKHLPVFQVEIPRSVVVEEAHLLRKTLFDYAPKHKATQKLKEFVEEALQKMEAA